MMQCGAGSCAPEYQTPPPGAADVISVAAGNDLPLKQMGKIARAWAMSRGGEHGFSMGRYSPHLVAQKQVFLIYQHAELVGFVTCMTGKELDLIRHVDHVPDDALQSAIFTVIETARSEKTRHVSLACAPDPPFAPPFWSNRRAGLIQFKRGFQPIWVPRYHAAPKQAGFWFTGVMIGLASPRPFHNAPWILVLALKIIMQKYQGLTAKWRL
ncbi:phosphatidylglycerol lysyltransferase domain-containing protein [Yoonia sediminilitoris]|uniref:Uncharacterized protein DUF2156 n=1 Tax=Yoonia sediminilitoris TaxID=1286148 RepID=A0A2T6K943_9RHOB|nr:phosphatidylglycerol lysyltransferase domain-containing protein [Yoonia sediminilitoris]PUB11282.1 uncharacterized protein DUF2156 [Yoonia sediminilitoris]RCW91098.1 uncharacterized protein DUF2156 [Yoonia sediminilitoris]